MKLIDMNKDMELHKTGKTCCNCFETKGIYTLKELRDVKDTVPSVKMQAMLLLQEYGHKEEDKFCEDCFWK